MTTFLVIVAALAGVLAWFFVSQATAGVAILATACLFGILARIAQSAAQHEEYVCLQKTGLTLREFREREETKRLRNLKES